MCSWRTQMRKSDSLNSYGMFQPSAPNLRRSWMSAWKKASPKKSFLSAAGFGHEANHASSRERKEPARLARSPRGGSLVILTPFCSTATGKCLAGAAVSHSRKSACARSGVSSSQRRSSAPIHEGARWQFCSTTQPPLPSASWIIRSASGPCPCPSEIDWSRRW